MTIVIGAVQGTAPPAPHAVGDHWEIYCALTYSSTYSSGGEAIATRIEAILKQVGAGIIDWVSVQGAPGYIYSYNYKTGKLQLYWTGAEASKILAEFTNATEYPAAVREAGSARMFVVGK